jgi:hypothetical protein
MNKELYYLSIVEPLQIPGLNNIIAVSASRGDVRSLFLKDDGTVWACGWNRYGELGDGTTTNRSVPFRINALSGIVAISASSNHSLFLKKDGTVWACGSNDSGQLGDSTAVEKHTPMQIPHLYNITAICEKGHGNSFFLKNDSTVWACGVNNGLLGDGTTTSRSYPVKLFNLCAVAKTPAIKFSMDSIYDDFNVYPIPSADKFIIDFGNAQQTENSVTIFSALGQVLYLEKAVKSRFTVDFSAKPQGIYYYRAQREEIVLKTGKMIFRSD